MAQPSSLIDATDGDACYLAMKTHDARFDGAFFTAVTSTGIYCRPVCRVKLARRENCRFYRHAAQAEAAGFRPCLRCRPELAPRASNAAWSTEDASRTLALQAARLMDEPEEWTSLAPTLPASRGSLPPEEALAASGRPGGGGLAPTLPASRGSLPPEGALAALGRPGGGGLAPTLPASRGSLPPEGALAASGRPGGGSVSQVAQRLGVSDRHLRRIFAAQFGVSPLQYLLTRRLLAAKQLLADTQLPLAEVAQASGFGSARRFHSAFVQHYSLSPGALRRTAPAPGDGQIVVRLGWRPPYDVAAVLGFMARRTLPGVEQPTPDGLGIRRTLRIVQGAQVRTGWLQVTFETEASRVQLRLAESLAPVLPLLIARVRAWLDLDADPQPIHAVLGADFPAGEGLRVPGTLDGFELAVRAVLGQQITVAGARTMGGRLAQAFGEPIATPFAGLDRLFPMPAALAAAEPEHLGRLGIVRQRQAALQALARETLEGRLLLHAGTDPVRTCAALQALPGIGDWTAQYIAMRALRWPDAFPAGDIALQKALGVKNARAAAQASQAWRPWRSYAVLRAWQAAA